MAGADIFSKSLELFSQWFQQGKTYTILLDGVKVSSSSSLSLTEDTKYYKAGHNAVSYVNTHGHVEQSYASGPAHTFSQGR